MFAQAKAYATVNLLYFMQKKEKDLDKKPVNKQTLRQLLGIYRFMLPYQGYFVGGLACLFFSSIVTLAFPYLTGKLIDVATAPNADWLLKDIDSIAAVLIGILLVQSVFSFLRVYFFAQVSERSMAEVRKTLYEKFMSLPMTFFDSRRTGELVSRINADVSFLQTTFTVTLAETFRQLSILIFGLGLLFWLTPQLTVFMLAIVPLLAVVGLFFGKYIRRLSKETQDKLADSNIVVEETLQSVSMVKAFTNETYETSRYGKTLAETVKIALHSANYRGAFISFMITAVFGAIVAVLWYGTRMVQAGELTFGELTSFVINTMFIGGSIGGLGDMYGQLQKAVGSSDRVMEILALESETELTAPKTDYQVIGNISYQNVQFAYPTRKEVEVLKNVNFEIKKGEKIALVGQSGAGKSTVVQLLMRFYPIDQGEIRLDGTKITDYDLRSYRSHIGIVPQEVILFGGTIMENIAYGKPNATFEEIRQAAQQAYALEFIEKFPEQFETIVGERGIKLSGGQRQRIAIARAILKNPEILILDEATSSLDAESEYWVQEALKTLMKNRTTIIIAHRLATIREVDRIYVLDKGQIIEQGTHESLLERTEGVYSNLIKFQLTEA